LVNQINAIFKIQIITTYPKMNRLLLYLITISLFTFSACSDEFEELSDNQNFLEVITEEATEINATFAKVPVQITKLKDKEILAFGLAYSTTPNPTINDERIDQGIFNENFVMQLENLFEDTKYYARAFAQIKKGIVYGNEIEFTTLLNLAPCKTEENVLPGHELDPFNTVKISTQTEFIILSTSNQFEFTIQFNSEPRSGKYETTNQINNVSDSNCYFQLNWKSIGELLDLDAIYIANENQNVYVKNNGNNNISIDFCDVIMVFNNEDYGIYQQSSFSGNMTLN